MKKKAVLKTILDVIKLIAKSVIVIAIPTVIVMLFQLFNLFSTYGTYRHIPYGLVFVVGILIILGTFLVIHLIRAQYIINLEEINKNNIIQLKNDNPTNAEKGLYHNYGYYPVERHPISNGNSDADYTYIRYAVCYTEPEQRKSYPSVIKIEKKNIDYEDSITFEACAESVKITGRVDVDLLEIITERAKEIFESEKKQEK